MPSAVSGEGSARFWGGLCLWEGGGNDGIGRAEFDIGKMQHLGRILLKNDLQMMMYFYYITYLLNFVQKIQSN